MADVFAVFPVPAVADPATRAFIERVNAAKTAPFHTLTPAAFGGGAGRR